MAYPCKFYSIAQGARTAATLRASKFSQAEEDLEAPCKMLGQRPFFRKIRLDIIKGLAIYIEKSWEYLALRGLNVKRSAWHIARY